MSSFSFLLFLTGAFTIYISVCLFLNVQLLGGILKNNQTDPVNTDNNSSSEDQIKSEEIYFNSYIHMFIFLSGILALIVSFLGCCTSRVHDRCCVLSFTVVISAILVVFTAFGLLMLSIHLQSHDFVKNYCSESDLTELKPNSASSFNNFFLKVAKDIESGFHSVTKAGFSNIDGVFQDNLDRYMCKKQCQCDPRIRNSLSRWSPEQIVKLSDESVYLYDGWYTNFYDCYQDLVKNKIILPENRIGDKALMFIQDFEKNLNCAGICKTPDFWFYQELYSGPPPNNCLTAMKNEFDKADGLLGYSFIAMSISLLLQLLSTCGLCCNRDRCL